MAGPIFARVPPELDFPKEEREILRFWKERGIFEKTLGEARAARHASSSTRGRRRPTACPHNGHVLTRVIKDLFPRYKTMRGWSVPRKAGWDTHGLPVEVEVEKELRIHGKAAIEEYGVEPFVKKCIESVFRYTSEWEELTERVALLGRPGRRVRHLPPVVRRERVVGARASSSRRGCSTRATRSSGGGRRAARRSARARWGRGTRRSTIRACTSRSRCVGRGETCRSLVWTTTPWTLPSNMYAAVQPDFDYVVVDARRTARASSSRRACVEALAKKLGELDGRARDEGRGARRHSRTRRRSTLFAERRRAAATTVVWRVIAADFVTLDAGTGIVHIAPAFGEDDHDAHRKHRAATGPTLPLFCAVKPDGTFVERFERYAGRWVKDCDKEHPARPQGRGPARPRRAVPPRLPVLLARRHRPAHPVRAPRLVHPHDGAQGPGHREQPRRPLAARAHQGGALRRLPRQQRRLGALARALVGHAAQRLDLRPGRRAQGRAAERRRDRGAQPARVRALPRRAREADPTLSEHLIVHKPWIDQVTFPCASVRRRPCAACPRSSTAGSTRAACPSRSGAIRTRGLEGAVRAELPGRLHQRGDRPDARLVLLAAHDLDARLRRRSAVPAPRTRRASCSGTSSDKEGKKESKSKGNYTPPEIILDEVAMEFAVVDGEPDARKGARRRSRSSAARTSRGSTCRTARHVRVYRARRARRAPCELALRAQEAAAARRRPAPRTTARRSASCRRRRPT